MRDEETFPFLFLLMTKVTVQLHIKYLGYVAYLEPQILIEIKNRKNKRLACNLGGLSPAMDEYGSMMMLKNKLKLGIGYLHAVVGKNLRVEIQCEGNLTRPERYRKLFSKCSTKNVLKRLSKYLLDF